MDDLRSEDHPTDATDGESTSDADETAVETPVAEPEPSRKAEGETILRNTGIVGGFLLIGRVVGIFREIVISRVIGTSAAADAFRFAYESILQDLFTKFEKLLQPIYIPIFVARQRADGDEKAWEFARVVGTLQLLALAALAVLGSLFAPSIVTRIAAGHGSIQPGTSGFDLTVFFLRMFFPALIVFSLSNLAELTIQSYKHFTIPALAEAVRRVLLVGAVVAAVVLFKGEGGPTAHQATMCLAWGAVAGCLARMLIQLPKLWQYRQWMKPSLALANPDVKKASILAIPLVVGIVFAFARNLLEARFAFDEGEGAFSALKYARKLVDMPWQIVSLALSYVIYPFISELGAKKDNASMADALVKVVRVMVFVFAPITVYFLAMGEPVVRVAFQGGSFDETSVALTNSALPWYVMGLVFFAIEDPLLKWFYAMSDTKTPIALGIAADLVWFGAAFIGVKQLGLGLPALAAAFSIQKVIKVFVVLLVLRVRLGGIPMALTVPFFGKMILTCTILGFSVSGISHVVEPMIPGSGLMHHGVHLVAMAAVALVIFVVASYVFRVDELNLVIERLRKKIKR